MSHAIRLPILLLSALPALADWTQLPLSENGYATAVAYQGDTAYAGTAHGGGVYRSFDHGKSWSILPGSIAPGDVHLIASQGRWLYVANTEPASVQRTGDGGKTWERLAPETDSIGGVTAILPFEDKLAVGLGNGKIYVSADSGRTWLDHSAGLPGWGGIYTLDAWEGAFFAGTTGGLYRYRAGDSAWLPVYSTASQFYVNYVSGVCFTQKAWIVSTANKVMRSLDAGKTWQVSYDPINGIGPTSLLKVGSRTCAAMQTGDVVCTRDDGATWTHDAYVYGPAGAAQRGAHLLTSLDFNFGPLYSAKIWSSGDGGLTWSPAWSGVRSTRIASVVAQGHRVFAAGIQDDTLFRSDDHGGTWTRVTGTGLDGDRVGSLSGGTDSVLVATNPMGYMSRSLDRGDTWNRVQTGYYNGSGEALAGDSVTYVLAYTGSGVVLGRNLQPGDRWEQAETPPSDYVKLLAATGPDLYASVYLGTGLFRLFRSQDGALTWTLGGGGLPDSNVYGVWAGKRAVFAEVRWENYRHAIFRSNDRGEHWTYLLSKWADEAVAMVEIGSAILVSNGQGLYLSRDGGLSWKPVSEGFGRPAVTSLTAGDGFVYAATNGAGIWRRSIAELLAGGSK